MTNKFAIKVLTELRGYGDKFANIGFDRKEAIDLAIKALEQQPCEDCISRAEALRRSHIEYDDDGEGHRVVYVEDIEELPSVTPQRKVTGSWVEKQVVDNEEVEIIEWQSARCSKCDKYHTTPYSYYFDDYKYCPNCGSYNGGDEE